MKYFSMFSGIGGFELGFPADWECVGYSEIDKYAIEVYEKHFPHHQNYGDATAIDPARLPDFDLLCGGFPCQAFSVAGKRHGFQDTRGTLFFDIARILAHKRPRYFLLENVKGLLSHDGGKTFQTILGVLTNIGYEYQWQVLNSKDFGVPQNRERVFIVGHLRGQPRPQVFPITRSCQQNNNSGRGLTPINFKHKAGDGMKTRMRGRTDICCTLFAKPGQNGAMLVDESQATGQSGTQIRRLTPIECERLQAYPDGWTEGISDTQRYKCLGNSVTVNVIRAISQKLLPNSYKRLHTSML